MDIVARIYIFANKVFYGQWSACTLLSVILIEWKKENTQQRRFIRYCLPNILMSLKTTTR